MLGSAFCARLADTPELLCLSRQALTPENWGALREQLLAWRPQIIIHTAADTDVEGAQSHPEKAAWANVHLPKLLAELVHEVSAQIVYFSSTGCYGDYKTQPYTETDPLQPTTVHHQSKAQGEFAVLQTQAQSLILRLGWLFGGDKTKPKNFVWARLQEARAQEEMYANPYQMGNPTWVEDVVSQTLALLQAGVHGTFNCVAQGCVSRLGYVQQILDCAGLSTRLVPRRFERKAPVSPNEVALNDALEHLQMNLMPRWEVALARYIRLLMETSI
jgi:dTDP-4-dehydrorhamnose reductase